MSFAVEIGLLLRLALAAYIPPESNGMAEAFAKVSKCDYVSYS